MYTVRPDVVTELESLIGDIASIPTANIPAAYDSAFRFVRGLNPVLAQISGSLNRQVLALSSGISMPSLKGVADSASSITASMGAFLSGTSINWRP